MRASSSSGSRKRWHRTPTSRTCSSAMHLYRGCLGVRPRVDLLCREHRIVVELDGPEHRIEPKFGNDRHRDYELLTAGYLVLRLTNDQVAADLPWRSRRS